MADVYTDAGGKGSGTRADVRIATVTVTNTIAEPRRISAPGGRLQCMLRGLDPSIGEFREPPHRMHLLCYAARRVRVGVDLRYLACRTTVTANEADRMALREHSNGMMVEVLTVAR